MTQRTRISKRTSHKLSRCNYGQSNATRLMVAEPYPNALNSGMTPSQFQQFHRVRCGLELAGGRKVNSQEVRGAISLLALVAAFTRTAKIIERRKDIEDVMKMLSFVRLVTGLAVEQ